MRSFFIVLLLLAAGNVLYAQKPSIAWEHTFGGSLNEVCNAVIQCSDGGYCLVGWTVSEDGDVNGFHGGPRQDIWVLRLDANAKILWQRTLGGKGDIKNGMTYGTDVGWSVVQSADGGIVIAAQSNSLDGDVTDLHVDSLIAPDTWVVKLTSTGELAWEHTFGGSKLEEMCYMTTTLDGGYILAIESNSVDGDAVRNLGNSDLWVLKLKSDGSIDWHRNYGSAMGDRVFEIVNTVDSGYAIAGHRSDFWLVKLDKTGELQWDRTYGGSNHDEARGLVQTSDGGFVIVGATTSEDGQVSGKHPNYLFDAWVVKTDDTGKFVWQKTLGGSGSEVFEQVVEMPDGNFIMAGSSSSRDYDLWNNHGGPDAWVVCVSPTGELVWETSLGGSSTDIGTSIIKTSDNGIVVAGYTTSSDADVSSNAGGTDCWLVKLTSADRGVAQAVENALSLQAHPNPTSGVVNISFTSPEVAAPSLITVTDMEGTQVLRLTQPAFPGIHRRSLDLSQMAAGTYFITLSESDAFVTVPVSVHQ